MTRGARIFFRILAAVGFVIAGIVAFSGWMMWKRPLTVDAYFSRVALTRIGLEEQRMDGPAGRLTWFEGGTGPPMLLLHGAGDQAGSWARSAPALLERYRLIVPDLPGHWGSEPSDGPLPMDVLLGGVEALIDARDGGEPLVVVGNSLGAWIGFLLAVDRPDDLARLVALNGGPIRQDDPAVNLFPQTRDEARETMRGLMGPNSPEVPGFVLGDIVRWSRVGPAARFAATAADLERWLLDDRLDEVRVPVDLVWGDADALFPPAYAERLAAGLPAARLTLVPDCGHVPHRECPAELTDAVLGVLAMDPPVAEPPPETTGGDEPAEDGP
jgi:pimeloyl-ACP methyl ester carboxylesterase